MHRFFLLPLTGLAKSFSQCRHIETGPPIIRDLVDFLKEEYGKVEALIASIHAPPPGFSIGTLARPQRTALRELTKSLTALSYTDRKHLYPALELHETAVEEQVPQLVQEHDAMDGAMIRLERMSTATPEYANEVQNLLNLARAHVEHEMRHVLPALQRGLRRDVRLELERHIVADYYAAPSRASEVASKIEDDAHSMSLR